MENEPHLPSGASALEIAVLESPTSPPAALLMREYGFIFKSFPSLLSERSALLWRSSMEYEIVKLY